MGKKLSLFFEMLFVYAAIIFITAFSGVFVSLGGSIPMKMLNTLLLYIVMGLIPLFILKRNKITLTELGYSGNKIGKQLTIALCIFAVTFCLTVVIPLLMGFDKNDVLNFKSSSLEILIFYIIYDFLFVGFGEEFIFRGYFYDRIGRVLNSRLAAVIISSLLFGFWHYPHNHDIIQVIGTTVIGFIYGFSRYKIRNCTALTVSVAHGLQDTSITVLSYLLI
jgi:membrane protease YdiL (CAAX protease family)